MHKPSEVIRETDSNVSGYSLPSSGLLTAVNRSLRTAGVRFVNVSFRTVLRTRSADSLKRPDSKEQLTRYHLK